MEESTRSTIEKKLEKWCNTLLDLTKRNPAINFNTHYKSGKNIGSIRKTLTCFNIDIYNLFDSLVNKETDLSLEELQLVDFSDNEEFSEIIEDNGMEGDDSKFNELQENAQVKANKKDIENNKQIEKFRDLKNNTESILEDRGIQILYAVFGIYEWGDLQISDESLNTPLIFIPISVQKIKGLSRYSIKRSEIEEVKFNPTFCFLLKSRYSSDIGSEINNLLSENNDVSLGELFEKIENELKRIIKGNLRKEAWLGKFSFEKIIIYSDIMNNKDRFIDDPIIQKICGYGQREFIDFEVLGINAEKKDPKEIYEVIDADSSQRNAIEIATQGKDFVLIGPPGTGKSQTITNIIAESLVKGKKILFVSEKLAALNVVKKKLDDCNLGDFCLTLHGRKINKKDVYSELYDWSEKIQGFKNNNRSYSNLVYEDLRTKKDKLNEYAKSLGKNDTGISEIILDGGKVKKVNNYFVQARLIQLQNLPSVKSKLRINELDEAKLKQHKDILSKAIPFKDIILREVESDWFLCNKDLVYTADLQENVIEVVKKLSAINSIDKIANDVCKLINLKISLKLKILPELIVLIKLIISSPELEKNWLDFSNQCNISESISKEKDLFDELRNKKDELFIYFAESFITEPTRIAFKDTFNNDAFRFLKPSYWKGRGNLLKHKLHNSSFKIGIFSDSAIFNSIDTSIQIQKLLEQIDNSNEKLTELYGYLYQGEKTNWEQLAYSINYAKQMLNHINTRLGIPLSDISLKEDLLHCLRHKTDNMRKILNSQLQKLEESLELYNDGFKELGEYLPAALDEAIITNNKVEKYPAYNLGDEDLADLEIDFIKQRIKKLEDDILTEPNILERWLKYNSIEQSLKKEGLVDFINDFAKTCPQDFDKISEIYERRVFELLLAKIEKENKILAIEDADSLTELRSQFQQYDRRSIEMNRERVYDIVASEISNKLRSDVHDSDLTKLQRLGRQKRPRKPIRKAVSELKNLLFLIKPCWMMSPLTVSQLCPADTSLFDLIIFDEASQVRPADAIGSIFRGKQVIVVGDPKQLPPTNFFSNKLEEDEVLESEENPTDPPEESIIDEILAHAIGIHKISLQWHYRSQSEDLFAFSNHLIYSDSKLITFPNPATVHIDGRPLGVKHVYVEGKYDRGHTRTNVIEARRVAELVIEHFSKYPPYSDNFLSLGVIAFSSAQEEAIRDILYKKRNEFPKLENILESFDGEHFFVKNLENVQGDERDHIIISVGYGPDEKGQLTANFGPINGADGYRRLNVAITRARRHLILVSSFKYNSRPWNVTNKGSELLLKYLKYAELGTKSLFESNSEEEILYFDSPFEEEVYTRLEEKGLKLKTQIGCSGFRIDLGVLDPNNPERYLFGIECDGATYHGTPFARDRDRLRIEVLRSRGWYIHKIWSRAWKKNPTLEIEKILKLYNNCLENRK